MTDPTKMNTAIGKLIYDLFSPAIKEYGEGLKDRVNIYRKKNLEKIKLKIEKQLEQRNIEMKEVKFKILLPLVDHSSLEDDDILQEMWANLFINYIDLEKNLITNVYPDILRQVSSLEMEFLLAIEKNKNQYSFAINVEDEKDEVSKQFRLCIPNLVRVGLIFRSMNGYTFHFTEFGKDFIEACTNKHTKVIV